jgi:hypothetical protein
VVVVQVRLQRLQPQQLLQQQQQQLGGLDEEIRLSLIDLGEGGEEEEEEEEEEEM